MLGLVATLALVGATFGLRGVPPEKAEVYRADTNGNFACLSNPDIVIPFSKVNDDWCDCPDGSDEPGTGACSNGLFYCENKGHIPSYLPSFRVADGACDYDICCDGSDENDFGFISCPSRCKEVHAQYEKQLKKDQDEWTKGYQAKKTLMEKAQELKSNLVKNLHQEEDELVASKDSVLVHQDNLATVLKYEDENGVVADDLPQEIITARKGTTQLKSLVNNDLVLHLNRLQETNEKLGNILDTMKVDYNPNFNDPAVKAAIRGREEIQAQEEGNEDTKLTNVAEAVRLVLDEVSKALDDYEPAPVVEIDQNSWIPPAVSTHLESLQTFLENNNILAKGRRSGGSGMSKSQSDIVRTATANLEAAISRSGELQRLVDETTKDLSANYGENDVFRALKDICVKNTVGEYEYEVCFFGNIHQNGLGQSSKLGEFVSLEADRGLMQFDHGARCWNGPIRKSRVEFVCGSENKILTVSEPEKCEYFIKVATPAVCSASAPKKPDSFRINHDEL